MHNPNDCMKRLFLTFLMFSALPAFGQLTSGHIVYDVQIIEEGDKSTKTFEKTEGWEFEVDFQPGFCRMVKVYPEEKEIRIIDEEQDLVLMLSISPWDSMFYCNTIDERWKKDQRLSVFRDTIIKITYARETKLGYDCQKVEMELDGKAKYILWVTNDIECNAIVPNTPLSYGKIALEYSAEYGFKKIYKAREVTALTDAITTVIPDGFKCSVPIAVFDPYQEMNKPLPKDRFIQYPRYLGKEQDFTEAILEACKWKKLEYGSEEGRYLRIEFDIDKTGKVFKVHYDQSVSFEDRRKISDFLLNARFEPAQFQTQKVASKVTYPIFVE